MNLKRTSLGSLKLKLFPVYNAEMKQASISCQTDNDGRIRAASRVKEKMRRDSLIWTVDGRRRAKSSRNKRPSGAMTTLHSAPWNERFILQAVATRKNHTRPLSAYGKENSTNIARLTAVAVAGKSTPASKNIRHYSERSDGELVLNYSRCEILPCSNENNQDNHFQDSHLYGGTQEASVSPFDLVKLKAALLEAAQSDLESDADEADHEVSFPINSPYTKGVSPIDRKQANANLKAFEDLLYTVEIEEEIAHRELKSKALVTRTGDSPDHSSPANSSRDSKEESLDGEMKLSSTEIYNYVWQSDLASREREKCLLKDGILRFHDIVQM